MKQGDRLVEMRIGSKAQQRQVTVHPTGKAIFRCWYETTLGPTSAAYERQFASETDALEAAEIWVNERT